VGEGVQKSIPDAAFEVLREYLEVRAAFGAGDLGIVRDAFLYQRLRPGEFLQRAGDVARHAAFVATGCLRNYVIDPKGKEHIVQFAPERGGSRTRTASPPARLRRISSTRSKSRNCC
jgi:hypothetical protein